MIFNLLVDFHNANKYPFVKRTNKVLFCNNHYSTSKKNASHFLYYEISLLGYAFSVLFLVQGFSVMLKIAL